MKSLLTACAVLSFVHYHVREDIAWDTIVFCHDLIIVLLLLALFRLTPFKPLFAKAFVSILTIWRVGIMGTNAFNIEFAFGRKFIIAEAVFFAWFTLWQFVKDVEIESDECNTKHVFYLLSPPKEIFGLLLSSVWLPFGNRMVVFNGNIYYIKWGRFIKRPFHERFLEGRTLLNTGREMSHKLNDLTGKRAVMLWFDCRQYEVIFGSARKLIKSRGKQ